MALLVANILWLPDVDPTAALCERLGVDAAGVGSFTLIKRSVDGRRRPPRWLANYQVHLSGSLEAEVLERGPHGVRAWTARDEARFSEATGAPPPPVQRQPWPSSVRPIVIGAGPAGLFAALRLGEAGAPALLLERGGPVEERHGAVRRFWRHAELDPETNVVFGEGGAGAFSDGKIYTRRRDGELGYIFRALVDFGADPEILEEGWAHLGTDRIRALLPVFRARLQELGVSVRFHAPVSGFLVEKGRCIGVRLADGEEIRGGPVLVATGHSARDVWEAMLDAGAEADLRPIHVGARVEHPQRLINTARYGADHKDLPPASYRLTSRPPARKGRTPLRPAHTFCMCPGGTVVAASNHPGRVVVNGMSYSKRRAFWANSAVIVQVKPEDFDGTDPLAGVRYQDAIERAAWEAAGGGFRAPAQRVQDLLEGRPTEELGRTSYTNGVCPGDLRTVLPRPLIEGLKAALQHFDRRIPGFAGPEGVLIAPETRTTAPLRFRRDAAGQSTTVKDLLPVGEGFGYAGGIVSAALDGYRAATAVLDRHAPARSGGPRVSGT